MEDIHTQEIHVNTKGGLIAAFECAICDVPGVTLTTLIILERKTGASTWCIKSYRPRGLFGYETIRRRSWLHLKDITEVLPASNEGGIRRVKARLRKIPAKELLA